jgi:hypothetical protein
MRFGKSTEEAMKEPSRGGGGGGGFMKYLKDGDNFMHIMDEPSKWCWYWEHYDRGEGVSYPCTNEADCPGCTSENEQVAKVSRRVSFNAWDGEYTNVWKIPKTVADKLQNRFERLGTITDRPYIVTRLVTGTGKNAKYDFDLEGQDKGEYPEECDEYRRDPEEMLVQAYEEVWGSVAGLGATAAKKAEEKPKNRRLGVAKSEPKEETFPETKQGEDPPSEPEAETTSATGERVVTEDELRDMDVDTIRNLCETEGFGKPPAKLKTTDSIVDWMLEQ